MHIKHEAEICMECASIICQLIGSDVIEEGRKKVGTLVGTLWIYEETVSAPLRAYISSVERLIKNFQNLKEEIKESHKKLREEIKEEIFHALPVQTRVSAIKILCPPVQEKGYTP